MRTKIKSVLSQVFGLPIDAIADDASQATLEPWTSMGHLNLIMSLEESFGVRFSEDQIPQLTSVAAIEEALSALKS